jgi:hypothetical protein
MVTNYAILSLNLENYTASTDLTLDFSWADHNDEENPKDKVWVRGSIYDEWVEIYDIDPTAYTDNVYNNVQGLDIDQTLANASPSQIVSNTFQLRFGQQDNQSTMNDGISLDDILVEENSNKSAELIDPDQENVDFNIYYADGYVYIRSSGKAIEEEKQVLIYDLYGRTVVNQTVPPGLLSKIKVLPCSCYLVVKVLGKQQIKVEKVFVK